MRSEFIHLHLHTQFSLLDGACRIPELLNLAKLYKMDSLAITDHGNMFGAVDFYLEAQRAGIKPIIGCEVYVAPGSRLDKESRGIDEAAYHLILLARNESGYHNLMKLVSIAYLEGFYYRPRIDKEILSQYSKGLIGLSACLKGEIPSLIQQKRFNDALKLSDTYLNIFEKDCFYLELQENSIPEQEVVNKGLIKIGKELNLPLVATNDVHYLTRDRAPAHEALLCIQTQTTLDDPNRMRFQTNEFYFKSPQEMKDIFKEIPEAIANTCEIASRCNLELEFNKVHLPKYEPPVGKTKEEYLKELCAAGLKDKYEKVTPEVSERLEHELKIIQDMGFVSYFLIVWDFIHYAKSQGIPVGPGRGSAAGSLVSYLLGITDLDPLDYGLLFERFLNPERTGLPDIDIDFCYERRQEVIDYVTKKYGQENVAQIITFGKMRSKVVIRDVGRAVNIPYREVDAIAKMIPNILDITLEEAFKLEPRLLEEAKKNENIDKLLNLSRVLEGLNRHASTHDSGVVISDVPLVNLVPLYKSPKDNLVTQYSIDDIHIIGLSIFDFFGQRTLTVIKKALQMIEENRGIIIDISGLSLSDKSTYDLLRRGHTKGVFQLESSGMRKIIMSMKPECIEDIIAAIALYRPDPMIMIPDFIARKLGDAEITYEIPELEPILKETYGLILYQEQVMQIANVIGNYTITEADILRRIMCRQRATEMDHEKRKFLAKAKAREIPEQKVNNIWEQMVRFCEYGFNKSHSVAYSIITYQTAYLKTHYPDEFWAAQK